ncbi:hypothetical protein NLG97_g6572 [Lecanicillium saksenae]|uniref:Uncharacterized protein n=1 Tax=Lecanicillium saksenae TaxID=468837 RepID=A0ACC1QQK3_9HYPO|nr:hypothetical protein NLG97_g6572 [Lecanicillium saksenae]
MPPRIILLAGAPSPSSFDEKCGTVEYFNEPFRQFLGSDGHHAGCHESSVATIAPWRSIALHREPLHTGFSQANDFLERSLNGDFQDADFFCPSSLTSSYAGADSRKGDEAALSEFCEQSLALHNSLPSSQLGEEDLTTTFLEETSFLSTSTATNVTSAPRPPAPNIPPAHLSDLEDIPSAKQVISLQPQTITVNIIAGILSIAQPRSVTTKWGRTLSLVEVLLGDDTRSGFAVTFWLSSDAVPTSEIPRLRRQDVVLLQNVALHVFRGKVYGQSLRRGQTKVHLLWSKRKDARASYSSRTLSNTFTPENPQILKTKLVRDWVLQFVGIDPDLRAVQNQNVWDRPPEDSQ